MPFVCAILTTHLSFISNPNPHAPLFFITFKWMHSMYFANFEFNEEWQGDQNFKKLENLIVACNYTNCTMPGQGWEILIPQPN